MAFRHCKISEKAGNLKRQKGTCMKCYDMEVLDAEMSFFQPGDDLRSHVNLGNDLITKWWVFEPTLHLRLSNC